MRNKIPCLYRNHPGMIFKTWQHSRVVYVNVSITILESAAGLLAWGMEIHPCIVLHPTDLQVMCCYRPIFLSLGLS